VKTPKAGFLMLFLVLGMLPNAMAQTTEGKVTLVGSKTMGTTAINNASAASFASISKARSQPHPNLVAARRAFMPNQIASAAAALAATLRPGSQAQYSEERRKPFRLRWSYHR
jgi:hypothetical protein